MKYAALTAEDVEELKVLRTAKALPKVKQILVDRVGALSADLLQPQTDAINHILKTQITTLAQIYEAVAAEKMETKPKFRKVVQGQES